MKILSVIILSLAFVAKAADTNALPALVPAYGEIPPTFLGQHETLVIIGVSAFIIVVALALWKMFQPKPAAVLPPEIVAREALAKLLRQPEDGKFMSEASQILRRYVVATFELSPVEMTTAEFCAALVANEKVGAEMAGLISVFLRECDERKFSTSPAAAPLNAASRAMEIVELAEKRRAKLLAQTSVAQ